MSGINRYTHKWDKTGMTRAFESPNGEWVRREDMQELLDAQAEELRLMQERINWLVTK